MGITLKPNDDDSIGHTKQAGLLGQGMMSLVSGLQFTEACLVALG